jgi:nitrous oxide reductase accessory protein NosL
MIEPTRRILQRALRLLGGTACALLLVSLAGCHSDEAAPARTEAPSASATAPSAVASAQAAPTGDGRSPAPGKPLADDGSMQIGPSDRCPVCAMKVDEHKKFASGIQLEDGRTHYFCGTGCMLRTWIHPEAFLGASKSQLRRAVVRDYFTGKHLDAGKAIWVAGSDVVGPMGPAIVPLADEASAAEFKKRHGGKATFKLSDLDDAMWEKLTGKKAAR